MERLPQIQWLFFDPSVLLNETGTDREARRLVAAALAKRGRPVDQDQVERAWMQAIAATRPVHPLAGAIRLLAPDGNSARAILDEVLRNLRNQDTLVTGLQLALGALQPRFQLGVIGPYRTPGSRARLERFHLHFHLVALSDEQQLSHALDPAGKVDPALFVWALRKAGCPANHAAFASDRVDLGLAPAKLAGMTTIWLRQTNHKLRYPRNSTESPDLTYNSLPDMARVLTQQGG